MLVCWDRHLSSSRPPHHSSRRPATAALIAEVSAGSPAFTEMWERQAIEVPDRKAKTFRHDDLGDLKLDFELLTAIDSPNQVLVVCL